MWQNFIPLLIVIGLLVLAALVSRKRRRRQRRPAAPPSQPVFTDDWMSKEVVDYERYANQYASIYLELMKHGYELFLREIIAGQIEASFTKGSDWLAVQVTHLGISYQGSPASLLLFRRLLEDPPVRAA